MSKNWTEEEQILALNLYHLLPFGRLSQGTPEIKALAALMDRTPSSLAMKLTNFASLDPVIQATGRKGLPNVSNKDRSIWQWHLDYPEEFRERSERLSKRLEDDAEVFAADEPVNVQSDIPVTEKSQTVTIRVGQSVFRKMVLENYQSTCCFSGINIPTLLVASHIVPWSVDAQQRLNPRNGLCLSSLHDRAFDQGLWTLNTHGEIQLSERLLRSQSGAVVVNFREYEGKPLRAAHTHAIDDRLMQYHRTHIFKA